LSRASKKLNTLPGMSPAEIHTALPAVLRECRELLKAAQQKATTTGLESIDGTDRGGLMWRMDYARERSLNRILCGVLGWRDWHRFPFNLAQERFDGWQAAFSGEGGILAIGC